MKLKNLIELLQRYNLDANVQIVVDSHPCDFEILYGSSEGCTKENCEDVYLSIDLYNHENM